MSIFLKASTKHLDTPCDNNRMTPLHAAVARGHCSTVAILTAAGADVDAVDADGKTALHYAAKKRHYKCLMVRGPCRRTKRRTLQLVHVVCQQVQRGVLLQSQPSPSTPIGPRDNQPELALATRSAVALLHASPV